MQHFLLQGLHYTQSAEFPPGSSPCPAQVLPGYPSLPFSRRPLLPLLYNVEIKVTAAWGIQQFWLLRLRELFFTESSVFPAVLMGMPTWSHLPSGRGAQFSVLSRCQTIARHDTVRTPPSPCKDGWKVHTYQGLLLKSGLFTAICFGVQVSATAHRQVSVPAGPSSASLFHGLHGQDLSTKRIFTQATPACLSHKHSPNLCHTNFAKEDGEVTVHKHTSLLDHVLHLKQRGKKYVVTKKRSYHKDPEEGKNLLSSKRQTSTIFVRRCLLIKICQIVFKKRLY